MRFGGKIGVVTGGARGIGRATAERLVREGGRVAILDTDEEVAMSAANEFGSEALGVRCDVSKATDVESAIDSVIERWGQIDVLVNNAGITRNRLIHEMSDDDWGEVLAVNLTGSFLCAREAQRFMVKQRSGKIVNVSSQAALGTERGYVNYSASKAGIQGLTRALALDLGPFNINVNAVAPGHVETQATRGWAERAGIPYEAMREEHAARNAIGRVAQPEDVAAAILFLASEDARHITGQVLYVTGRPFGPVK